MQEVVHFKNGLYIFTGIHDTIAPKSVVFKIKVPHVIREGVSKFEIKEVYLDNGIVMVKTQSINCFDNGTKEIIRPETEIMDLYQIQTLAD